MAFVDTRTTKRFQATLQKSRSNTATAMMGSDDQVMKKAPSTVVATEDGADQLLAGRSHEAQLRIAFEEDFD